MGAAAELERKNRLQNSRGRSTGDLNSKFGQPVLSGNEQRCQA